MTFGEAISDALSKYANFSGRSSRSAYWWFYLFTVLVLIGAGILDRILGTVAIYAIAALALLLPSLAVLVRRFHDAGHSGWWALILLVPIVGFFVWLIFALTQSAPPNKWGEGPDMPARPGAGGLTMPPPQGPPADPTPPSQGPPPPANGST